MMPNNIPGAKELAMRFDPYGDSYLSDPYPFFAEARKAAPVFYSPQEDCWVVTRYEDMRHVFQNPRQFSASVALAIKPVCPMAMRAFVESNFNSVPTLTITDPPAHTRIRRLSNLAMSPKRISDLEPFTREFVGRFVDAHAREGRADLVRDLAWDLPAQLMFRLIGVPEADLPQISRATTRSKLLLWGRPNEEEQIHAAEGIAAFWTYITRMVADRAETPRDDFTTALLQARVPDLQPLDHAEIASIIFGILVAGHETTTALLGNGMHRLLEHREAWEQISRDPALIPNAIEEVLRIDSSVIGWRRKTTEPVVLAGVPIPAEATILMLLGSANRDPAVFENPEVFDIHRENARNNLSFGHGNHFCIGAPLARLAARAVFHELSVRLPSLRLAPNQTPQFAPNLLFRGLVSLPVEWDV